MARLLSQVRAFDALLDRQDPKSLDPARARATPLEALIATHEAALGRTRDAFVGALLRCAQAQREAFPANIFWDLDALAQALAECAVAGGEGRRSLAYRSALVVALQTLFGRATPIHFQYVHDFMYGFDWVKWVRKAPEERRGEGPFSATFLEAIWRRGHELLTLISRDDPEYPRLASGMPRNPFAFSRSPEDEEALWRALHAAEAIPVLSYERSPTLDPSIDYAAKRLEIAQTMDG